MKTKIPLPALLTAVFLSFPCLAFSSSGCDGYPECGQYICVDYANGIWKNSSNNKIENAYIRASDSTDEVALVITKDGYVNGKLDRVLAICK